MAMSDGAADFVYTQQGGGVYILWTLATADEPLTAAEIADSLDATADNVRGNCIRLWRSGLVLRRTRETDGAHTDPFEYTIAPREEVSADDE